MTRTQVYLTDLENERIKNIIKTNGGGTKAEHIRRAIDQYLDKNQSTIMTNIFGFISPGFQPYMERLPEKLHIGRKVRVIRGNNIGRTGIVTDHWQNLDDCSGGYGNHLYQLEGDLEKYGCKNNSCAINTKDCDFID